MISRIPIVEVRIINNCRRRELEQVVSAFSCLGENCSDNEVTVNVRSVGERLSNEKLSMICIPVPRLYAQNPLKLRYMLNV